MALVIGAEQQAALYVLREMALAQPVDMRLLAAKLAAPAGKAAHRSQMTRQSLMLPMHYLVTYSVEIGHPVGECRHMSMSASRNGYLPSPDAVQIVAELLGFVGPVLDCTWWIEELEGHGKSVNVVQPLAVARPATT